MGVYGSAPSTPDPATTAAAQTATNVSTATANAYLGNVNQMTPNGNLTYSYGQSKDIYDPTTKKTYSVPTTTVTTTLSPQQQAIADQNNVADKNLATLAATQSGKLNDLLGTPMSLSGAAAAGNASSLNAPSYSQFASAPTLQSSTANAGDITKSYDLGSSQEYQDALMTRLQPSLDQNRSALEQKLANQGLQPGSEAYNRAVDEANRSETDARYGAILNAGQYQTQQAALKQGLATFQNAAQQQQYNQNLSDTQLANNSAQQTFQNQNTAVAGNNTLEDQSFNAQQQIINAQNTQRANYLNEQYAQRNQPINEISSLLSGAQVTNPNFVSTQGQSMPTVDYAGLVNQNYQNKLAAYQQDQAGIGSLLGGVGSLFALSDRTAKKDIKKVGGLYEYRYKGEGKDAPKRIGVMAQEVEKVRPNAVRRGSDGLRRVNYGALFSSGVGA